MKIIAHGIKNLLEAKKAIHAGVDFLEIDVSKRFFFNKFTAQHNGILGIAGIGTMLEKILTAEVKTRAFLDLKPVSYRNSFTHKFTELLIKLSVKNAKVCGHNWQMLSNLSNDINAKPYYTIKNIEGLRRLKKIIKELKKPRGFSVRHDLIDEKFMAWIRTLSAGRQVWAWTVNDLKEAKRLTKLGVDGIITDNWESLLKFR
ncbi:hypothetical protein A2696_04125 [Candidatus Curtissbacteria bacterium RIFCSPHIGHO2_01_FULL_41_13]|uniref:GP-PDE domain-containing protein n=1 Tax=Candidatus Curtissbacteria bacterium RIFCSPHIGHO2_01_FULL_41_13 TaxID=1797745 RepID=A0A1F5FZ87_9BACT|nr:MAG: hypothetical protein A2696_04125 [Candidatus Curtissbacteria bacterium RIFCSPHIGHO2_01_FULL_41_13]